MRDLMVGSRKGLIRFSRTGADGRKRAARIFWPNRCRFSCVIRATMRFMWR